MSSSRKEIKVFDENIPGFSMGTKRFKVAQLACSGAAQSH